MRLFVLLTLICLTLAGKEPEWQDGTLTAIDKGTARVYGSSNKAVYYTVRAGQREITGVLVSRTRFSDYRLLPLTTGETVRVAVDGSTVRIQAKDGKMHKLTLDRERQASPR